MILAAKRRAEREPIVARLTAGPNNQIKHDSELQQRLTLKRKFSNDDHEDEPVAKIKVPTACAELLEEMECYEKCVNKQIAKRMQMLEREPDEFPIPLLTAQAVILSISFHS